MNDWTPRRVWNLDFSQLDLDAEMDLLLPCIDGSTTVAQLTELAGLPEEKVEEILGRLTEQGALESHGPPDGAPEDPGPPETVEEVPPPAEEAPPPAEEAPEDEPSEARSWRRVFEQDFHPLEVDARVELARQTAGAALCALCFDPSAKVVTAVVENPKVGLQHARLIAEHHRTGVGLDQMGRRAEFLRDRQVQRHLYRNPQCGVALLLRLLASQRMGDVYRLAVNRETTERVRSTARKEFRKKFTSGSAEERVNLIVKGEGRCLALLIGVALDGKAASLLCGRPLHSTLLIQNLARWPSTPPPVLQHMARQPIVLRSAALKNLILRHPNVPSQLKAGRRF